MNQKIFQLGLSVEATSLYLLLASLSDSGCDLDREMILPIWNSTPAKLDEATEELLGCNVAAREAKGSLVLLPASDWVG